MQSEVQAIAPETIEQQLKRLQSSPLFSHSRRYPLFLEYVVRQTMGGHRSDLKERTIGIEAFGRVSNYDLNEDPVVRVTAGEVRKRLAQYYYEPEHRDELRIELKPGSYIPEFRFPDHEGAGPERLADEAGGANPQNVLSRVSSVQTTLMAPPHSDLLAEAPRLARDGHPNIWKAVALVLAVALLGTGTVALMPLLHRSSAMDTFWQPVIEANGPVLISVGSVVAMVNDFAVAPPSSTISGHPLSSDPIAVSDALALSSIQQVLSTRSKPSTLQSSTSTSFSDLQKGPIVLISGFNNLWTVRLTESLHFHLVRIGTDVYSIQDRGDPTHNPWSINTGTPFARMSHDYGLVARFHDPTTEQIVVVAAGIGENGTVAASRLLTDERYLSELKRDKHLPRPDQNFECVVETQIIDGKPGPPRIVATYFW
jgi:hypothetical protein